MRRALAGLLLASPAVIAFATGGFPARPALVAATLAWLATAAAVAIAARPLPGAPRALVAVGGLAGLVAFTAASVAWAPRADPAVVDAARGSMYLAVLVSGAALLRGRLQRAVEPGLAAGAVVVVGYGLATRLLPDLVPSQRSISAGGRLEQPLTYWNGLGIVAALGALLLIRLAADRERDRRLRAAAAALAPALLLALWMTVSRGALAAFGVGLAVLLLASRDRRTLETAALALAAGGLAVLGTGDMPGFQHLRGDSGALRAQGLVALGVLAACCAAALAAHVALAGERRPRIGVALLLVLVPLGAALAGVGYAGTIDEEQEREVSFQRGATGATLPSGAERLRTLRSNRYEYWKVARRAFLDSPLHGEGAHAFANRWLRERPINEPVQDAHSLYLETAAELGLAGVLLLVAFLGGGVACALSVRRRLPDGRALTTGWLAAGAAWLAHAGLDWDWEMPAVTLPFVLLCAAAVAAEDERYAGSTQAGSRRGRG